MEKSKEIKKKGRPTIGNAKLEAFFRCRLHQIELKKLIEDAEKVNLKPSELARQYIVKGYVSNVFSDDEQNEKRQLIGIRNNLNQLVKLVHIGGYRSQEVELNKLLKQIDEILTRYNYVSQSKSRR